jgi:hypothetical protein
MTDSYLVALRKNFVARRGKQYFVTVNIESIYDTVYQDFIIYIY